MLRLRWLSFALLSALAAAGVSQTVKRRSISVASDPALTCAGVIGETSRQAVHRLETAGFSVRPRHRAVSRSSRSGIEGSTPRTFAHVGSRLTPSVVGRSAGRVFGNEARDMRSPGTDALPRIAFLSLGYCSRKAAPLPLSYPRSNESAQATPLSSCATPRSRAASYDWVSP